MSEAHRPESGRPGPGGMDVFDGTKHYTVTPEGERVVHDDGLTDPTAEPDEGGLPEPIVGHIYDDGAGCRYFVRQVDPVFYEPKFPIDDEGAIFRDAIFRFSLANVTRPDRSSDFIHINVN